MESWQSLRAMAFFFFNDTATTEIYTLSLHDALPICEHCVGFFARPFLEQLQLGLAHDQRDHDLDDRVAALLLARSEEHTSELQSQSNLVCRLLLEKKKKWRPPLLPP